MANIKSAKKRIKVNARNEMRNKMFKSQIKTSIRKIDKVEGENKELALREALSNLDRAVSKGVLKKNTAARKKSLIARKFNQAV